MTLTTMTAAVTTAAQSLNRSHVGDTVSFAVEIPRGFRNPDGGVAAAAGALESVSRVGALMRVTVDGRTHFIPMAAPVDITAGPSRAAPQVPAWEPTAKRSVNHVSPLDILNPDIVCADQVTDAHTGHPVEFSVGDVIVYGTLEQVKLLPQLGMVDLTVDAQIFTLPVGKPVTIAP